MHLLQFWLARRRQIALCSPNAWLRLQDVVAGDGTTTVTVLCGALLSRCLGLLDKGVHPTLISESFQTACDKAIEIVKETAQPVDLKDRDALIDAAMTCAPAGPEALL